MVPKGLFRSYKGRCLDTSGFLGRDRSASARSGDTASLLARRPAPFGRPRRSSRALDNSLDRSLFVLYTNRLSERLIFTQPGSTSSVTFAFSSGVVAETKSISESAHGDLVAVSSGNALYFITNPCFLGSRGLVRAAGAVRWTRDIFRSFEGLEAVVHLKS